MLSLLLGACGVVAALLGWRLVWPLIEVDAAAASTGVRLGAAVGALLPAAGVLAAMILAQMAARLLAGVFDPASGRETRFLALNQRVITNTVEQLVVFAIALPALAAAVAGAQLAQVLALGAVFAVARLAFWAGYLAAPTARAPGMAASMAVNAATLLAAAWFWLR